MEQEIFKIERDLKKLSEKIDERFKQTFSKIEEAESTVKITHEGEMKMLDNILRRFTKLIEVVGNILKRELELAKEKIDEELSKPLTEE